MRPAAKDAETPLGGVGVVGLVDVVVDGSAGVVGSGWVSGLVGAVDSTGVDVDVDVDVDPPPSVLGVDTTRAGVAEPGAVVEVEPGAVVEVEPGAVVEVEPGAVVEVDAGDDDGDAEAAAVVEVFAAAEDGSLLTSTRMVPAVEGVASVGAVVWVVDAPVDCLADGFEGCVATGLDVGFGSPTDLGVVAGSTLLELMMRPCCRSGPTRAPVSILVAPAVLPVGAVVEDVDGAAGAAPSTTDPSEFPDLFPSTM